MPTHHQAGPSAGTCSSIDARTQRSRTTVLAAATDLLESTGGVGGFSVDEVARRSGVAKTTIYRHWPTREASCSMRVQVSMIATTSPPTPGLFMRPQDVRRRSRAHGGAGGMGCCAAFDCRCGGTQCRVRRYACADTKKGGARVPGESDRRTRDRSRRASCRNRYSTACIYRSRPSLLPSVVLPRTVRCCVHRCGHDSSYPRRTRIRLISATLYRDGHFNRNGSGSDGVQRQYG